MLLLVLILVLVAFGLLVIALLTSSVLWAWVSVAMSVAAASALLVDWLQRRSAVRDETEDGGAAPADLEARPVEPADVEPVTEFIPVVRPFDSTSHGSIGNGGTAGYSGGNRSAAFLDSRFHPARDAEQTVVMPIVQPSGSRERPSGATDGTAPAGDSSPSVTFPVPGEPVGERDLNGGWAVQNGGAGAAEATEAADRADEGATVTGAGSTSGTDTGSGSGTDTGTDTVSVSVSGSVSDTGSGSGSGTDSVTEIDADTDTDTRARPAPVFGSEAGAVSPHNGAAAGTAATMKSTSEPDDRSDGAGAERAVARSEPKPDPSVSFADAGQGAAENDDGGDGSTTIAGNGRGAVAEQPGRFPAPPERAEADPGADSEATVIVRSVTPATAQLPPAGPDGEPPEELPDAGLAGIIARLEDAVVVVDERPRYHLPTCPSVAANPLISLPVREAVEYGFTPCGWCTPDRALGDRHRTSAG
ncbi:MAG: hypothetical protein ACRDRK_03175 [Pseudonocardia sp.]